MVTSNLLPTKYKQLVGHIEEKYNVNLNVRSDMELSTFLKRSGYNSLAKLLEDAN